MSTLTVRFGLDDSARVDHLKATGERLPDAATLEIDLATLATPLRTRVVDRYGMRSDAGLYLDVNTTERNDGYSRPVWSLKALDKRDDAEAVLSTYFADLDAYRAAQIEKTLGEWTATRDELVALADRDDAELYNRFGGRSLPSIYPANYQVQERAIYEQFKEHPLVAETEALARPIRERIKQEEERRVAAHKVRCDAEKAEQAAAKAKAHAEKAAWIEAHGSDHLKLAWQREYDCQRLYVTERAALEFPDFTVDVDDTANWDDRTCPSPEALAEEVALSESHPDTEICTVWLTCPVGGMDEYDEFPTREAIVVSGFLGEYDLVKML